MQKEIALSLQDTMVKLATSDYAIIRLTDPYEGIVLRCIRFDNGTFKFFHMETGEQFTAEEFPADSWVIVSRGNW